MQPLLSIHGMNRRFNCFAINCVNSIITLEIICGKYSYLQDTSDLIDGFQIPRLAAIISTGQWKVWCNFSLFFRVFSLIFPLFSPLFLVDLQQSLTTEAKSIAEKQKPPQFGRIIFHPLSALISGENSRVKIASSHFKNCASLLNI